MRVVLRILKWISKNPWIWGTATQIKEFVIKPIINYFKKHKHERQGDSD